MTEFHGGSVSVDVVPSAESFWSDFKAQTQGGARTAGDDLGDSIAAPISDKVAKGVGDGLAKAAPASKEQGGKQGSGFADAFDKEVTTRLEAALRNLPKAQIDFDTSEADGKLLGIREQLASIGNARLDATLNDAEAIAALASLRAELDKLSSDSPDIRVRVDAGAASLELAGLQAQIDKLGGGPNGPRGPGGGFDIGGIGSGASGAASNLNGLLIPALIATAAVLGGPLLAVGGAAFGTLGLGALGLASEVKNDLTSSFKQLEATAVSALGPGVNGALVQLEGALPQLSPLIDVFGTEIGDVADEFATWLNDGGIKSFAAYAEQELPIVEGTVTSLSVAVVKFFADVTPLANVFLTALTGMADTFSAISDFTGKVLGAGDAPAGNTTGGAPVSGRENSGSIADRLGHNARAALINIGQFDPSGNPGYTPKTKPKAPVITPNPFNAVNVQATDQLTAADAQIAAQQHAATTIAAQYGLTADVYQTDSAKITASIDQQTLHMKEANDAAGLFSAALKGVGGDALGVAQSNTSFNQSLLTLSSTLKTNKNSLADHTTAGLADQAALEGLVQQAQSVYTATAQQTGSTLQAKAAYDAAIKSIENSTGATGKNKQAIDDYVTSIGKIPPVVSTAIDINDTIALDKLQDVQTRLLALAGASALAQTAAAQSIDQQLGSSSAFSRAQNKAVGGWVVGPGTSTSDSVPINSSAGEFVVNARAASANAGLLNSINAGQSPSPSGGLNGMRIVIDAGSIGTLTGHIVGTAQAVVGASNKSAAFLAGTSARVDV